MRSFRLVLLTAFCALLVANEQSINLGGGFYLERSADEFGARCHGFCERTRSGAKFYPLPQSSIEQWKKLRPQDIGNMLPPRSATNYQRQEVIGPYQVEGHRVWFGNHYYDGEGDTGVGAFGYFDEQTRRYHLFSPPEVARWEISALLIDPDAVWLGLDHFGEDISVLPGGFVRWDRKTQQAQRYPLEFLIEHIRRDANDPAVLILTTVGGYARFRDGEIERFRVQKSASGRETAVRINRFPPPPSKW